ncbi:zinc-binding dehydrogenase family protein [Striga asiatica]|uniref:Zinc-binding dehydrogenase family protein n=1 Tax=Striga asiatica TaxID=4170 RepID=A0A5A7QR03_STRAF|nr:zinc-binding dehydrogenase family protein [Striga asiatica]
MEEDKFLPNKQIVLKNFVQGCPKESHFDLTITNMSTNIRDYGSNGVLLKNLYLSCDPYLCHLMRPARLSSFLQGSFVPGSVVRGYGVAKVIKSAYEKLREGDYVWGVTGWEDFSWNSNPEKLLTKIETTDVPLSYYAGILGISGIAAYVGWYEICAPKQGEIVYISSAACGVGHLVGQFAKMSGCYVVGSSSTNEKVDLLKTKLGFDDAFNYKEGDLRSQLNKCFPRGIDIYFENVGGDMLDEVLGRMNLNGRVAVCGMISQYNLTEPKGIQNLFSVIHKRLTLRGFSEQDYRRSTYAEYAKWAIEKLRENKLVYVEEVIPGLENAASAFVGIYYGHNTGKRVIAIARD